MNQLEQQLKSVLGKYLSAIMAKSVVALSISRAGVNLAKLDSGDDHRLLGELKKGIVLYVESLSSQEKCIGQLSQLFADRPEKSADSGFREVFTIETEIDIVTTREEGRFICEKIGFSVAGQNKVATVVSELARNIIQYAGMGEIVIGTVFESGRAGIEVFARDRGPGIENLKSILDGKYRSKSGMGKGLTGTRLLMDEFDIRSVVGQGTEIMTRKYVA